MMKRFFAVLLSAALMLSLTACANDVRNTVSGVASDAGNAVSKVGEGAGNLVSDTASGAGSMASRAGEGVNRMESGMDGRDDGRTDDRLANDGEVRDQNGMLGDEDYEEAHDGVESNVSSHVNSMADRLTD